MALLITPIFWLPLIFGIRLLRSYWTVKEDDFTSMAALLTLKPFATTPIWLQVLSGTSLLDNSSLLTRCYVSIAPGAGLTLLTLIVFWPLFFGAKARTASWVLIALDCLRWGNSFMLSLTITGLLGSNSQACLQMAVGLTMPTIFAIVAWNAARL